MDDYVPCESPIFIPQSYTEFNTKYCNVPKYPVNMFARGFKYMSCVGSSNFISKGIIPGLFTTQKKWYNKDTAKFIDAINNKYPNAKLSLTTIRSPKYISYVWNQQIFDGITICVDQHIGECCSQKSRYKIALLSESYEISPKYTQDIHNHIKYYQLLLTHNKQLKEQYPDKAILVPSNAPTLDWNAIKIHTKSKICSYAVSSKSGNISGYVMRKHIINFLKE